VGERDRNADRLVGVLLVKILSIQLAEVRGNVVEFAKEHIEGAQDSRFARTVGADQTGVVVQRNGCVREGAQVLDAD